MKACARPYGPYDKKALLLLRICMNVTFVFSGTVQVGGGSGQVKRLSDMLEYTEKDQILVSLESTM